MTANRQSGNGPAAATMPLKASAPVMTQSAFMDFLDCYGADPAGWPDEAREPVRTTLAASPSAQRALERAGALEETLAAIAAPQPLDAALVGRIVSGLHGAKPHRERQLRLGFSRRLAVAGVWSLLLCAVLGVGLGLLIPGPAGSDGTEAGPEVAILVLGFDPGDLS